jgi:hypothetical protein
MNARRTSFILLAINFALVAIIGYLIYLIRISPNETRIVTQTKTVTNTHTQIAVRKINATNLLGLINRPANWAALESTNYYTYIANLRGFGCPQEVIKDIIITDIARLYARKRSEFRRKGEPFKYWMPEDAGAMDPKLQRQLAELDKEQRTLVRQLLGVELQAELSKYWEDDYDPASYAFLSEDKRDRLLGLKAKYDDMEQEVYARAQGLMLEQDEQELRQIQQQREKELASILTPQELEEYELRHSSVAETLRSQFGGFEPNEEEFRKLFRVQKDFEKEISQSLKPEDAAAVREDAQQALNEEMRKVLGPQRYAEWQRAQDPDYKALVQVADRFNLPKEISEGVYSLKMQAEQQKQQVDANPNLTPFQRQAALTAIAQETERAVAAAMPAKVFQSYRRAAGQWINTLGESEFQVTVNPELEP